jgi:hypothetical protein
MGCCQSMEGGMEDTVHVHVRAGGNQIKPGLDMSKAHAANGKVSKLGCLATCLNQALLQCMKSRAASQRQRKLIEAI